MKNRTTDRTTVRLLNLLLLLACVALDPVLCARNTDATFGVFFWLQVTDFDLFSFFFLCHFILLSRWFGLP